MKSPGLNDALRVGCRAGVGFVARIALDFLAVALAVYTYFRLWDEVNRLDD